MTGLDRVTKHRTQCSLGLALVAGTTGSVLGLSLCAICPSSLPVFRPLKLPTDKVPFESPELHLSLGDALHQWFQYHIGGLLELSAASPHLPVDLIGSPTGTLAPASPCCLQTPTVGLRVPFILDQTHTSKDVTSSQKKALNLPPVSSRSKSGVP